MPTIKLSDSVAAPVQEVFSFVSNVTESAVRNEDITSATQLTEGPVGVGTRFEMESKNMGKMEVEVTEYSEPNRILFSGSSPKFNARHEYLFTSEGEGTRMDQVVDMQIKGFAKFLAPLITPMARKGMRKGTAAMLGHFDA